MGIALKGDFIGFWIDDIHSSELGIIRTSDGSRFNENLLPTIQDKTVQVPGGDGFYYFGSYYTQRSFNIPIAFDNMEESQFRRLKQIIGNKKMVKLVFDEAPYKYYSVKSTGSSTLKYICFDVEDDTSGGGADEETQSGDSTPTQASAVENQDITNGTVYYQSTSSVVTKRVYKGEGTLSFVAYDPFGYARATSLNQLKLPNGEKITNSQEWIFNLEDSSGEYQYPLPTRLQTPIWNGSMDISNFKNSGDLPADYQIFCTMNRESGKAGSVKIQNVQAIDGAINDEAYTLLELKVDSSETNDNYCFDSKTNCVYGWDTIDGKRVPNNTIYNKYLTSGRFNKMPVGVQVFLANGVAEQPTIDVKFRYF